MSQMTFIFHAIFDLFLRQIYVFGRNIYYFMKFVIYLYLIAGFDGTLSCAEVTIFNFNNLFKK